MIVHDIVGIIDPGAPCSTGPGRWLIEYFEDIDAAHRRAELYNNCRFDDMKGSPGIRFVVESRDESDPDRPNYHGDRP